MSEIATDVRDRGKVSHERSCTAEDMIPLCAEESVAVQDLAILTSPVLQSIAHASRMHQQALVRGRL